jgi:[acyl-carrier-protein] S-malonyltransferase
MGPRRPVFLFPGQGSQFVGMGKDLYDRSPAAAKVFEEARSAAGFDLPGLCFNGPIDELTKTEYQQPGILTVSIAALAVFRESFAASPFCAIGHSLGEYSALVASGALSVSDAVRLTRKRGAFMQDAVPIGVGGMAALLGAEEATAEEICREVAGEVWVANLNGGGQVIISGKQEDVLRACELAKTRGVKRTIPLPVSAPFHSPLMKPAADRLLPELKSAGFAPMAFPVIANCDAQPNSDSARLVDLLHRQVTSRVLFEASVHAAVQMGADAFLEIGPGGKLTALVRRIVSDIPCYGAGTFEEVQEMSRRMI